MRHEPALDRKALAEAILEGWGLAASALTHIPAGEYGHCYRFEANGSRYFVKVWPEPKPGYVSTESTLAMLRLTRRLWETGAFPLQPEPILRRDGEIPGWIAGRLLAIFPFHDGAWPEPNEAIAAKLGRQMAQLHKATTTVATAPIKRETLGIRFQTSLPRDLEYLEEVGKDDRAELREARDLILPLRDEVLNELEQLITLSNMVRGIDAPFVLCHADLGLHNVIDTPDGALLFVDWDDVMLAPPEHDLFMTRGPYFAATLRAYAISSGVSRLHLQHMMFAWKRRLLDDFATRLETFVGDENGELSAHELYAMKRWVLPEWKERAATQAAIERALADSGLVVR